MVSKVLDAVEEENSVFDNVEMVVIESPEVRAENNKDFENKEPVPGAVNFLTGFQLPAPTNARNQNEELKILTRNPLLLCKKLPVAEKERNFAININLLYNLILLNCH